MTSIMGARILHKATTKEVHAHNVSLNHNTLCAYRWFDEHYGRKTESFHANILVCPCVNTSRFVHVVKG